MNKEINFEGKLVKPSPTGIYRCPYNCGQVGYPAKKWKTEKGFRKHMIECPKRPSSLELKILAEQQKEDLITSWKNTLEELKDQVLSQTPYKIGEIFYYSKKIVVKDTHENRGYRIVKVRYEAILRFETVQVTINTIDFSIPQREPDLEYAKQLIIINGFSPILTPLYKTFEEAEEISIKKTKADEEYRQNSSMLR